MRQLAGLVALVSLVFPATLWAAISGILPGGLLVAGMSLVYAADGRSDDPWIIESIQTGQSHGGMSNCSRIVIRYPGTAESEVRRRCVSGDMLYSFDPAAGKWEPTRPIAPGMRWESPGTDAASVARWETHRRSVETISGLAIAVIETHVYTSTNGVVVRRLRERYAPALETATGGVFEVPDPSADGGWRTQSRFELVEIRPSSPK